MKSMTTKILVLALAAAMFCGMTQTTQADEAKPIRVLLTYGGHGFEVEPFFAMFDKMKGIEYTKAEMPKQADLLKPGLEKDYDVILMYDMVTAITPEQQKAFVALLNKGIGLISWHHNMGAHRDWDEFRKITGGKYVFKEQELDGENHTLSTFAHDVDMDVKVVAKRHPIMRGIKDFTIHDEAYGNYYTRKGVRVLLTTDHPKNDPELAWVTRYGKSPVFYLMLGHDSKAWANPNFVKILKQGIQWTARRKMRMAAEAK